MSDVNHVVLIGRLVRDAELRYTPSNTAVCKFCLAVNKKRRDGDQWKDEAKFFEIVLWAKKAESLSQYLLKGKQIAVIGELDQERWDKDGENRSKVVITAENIQLLGGTSKDSEGTSAGKTHTVEKNQSSNSAPKQAELSAVADGDDFVDDIPY